MPPSNLAALMLVAGLLAAPASAQVQRNFPQNALRGEISFEAPPEIRINGRPQRLAPGVRIRGQNNMLEMSGALAGSRAPAHYTLDIGGEVSNVWLLRPEELANRPWPRTPKESQEWLFDPTAQTWSRP